MIEQLSHYLIIFLQYGSYLGIFLLVNLFVYDRFMQSRYPFLTHNPVIGPIYLEYSVLLAKRPFTNPRIRSTGSTKQRRMCPNFIKNLIKGICTMLSAIGVAKVDMMSRENLIYKNNNTEIFFDVDQYLYYKSHI